MSPEFYFLIFSFGLAVFFRKIVNKSPLWLNLILNVPGTIGHELCHALVGAIFRADVATINLIPKVSAGSITYGYVTFNNLNNFNALPVAMAPFLLLLVPFVSFELIINYNLDIYWIISLVFLTAMLCHSAIPSSVDFALLKNFIFGTIIWLTIFFSFIYSSYQIEINHIINFLKI